MKTHIIAAKEFLHRGIITENLKDEVTKFSKWCDERAKEGNPIKLPEKILQIWRTKSENTIAPTDGAMIVDFIETICCEDLDIIYNICLIRIIEETMIIYVAPPIEETVAKIESYFDNEDIVTKMRVFMRTNKATYLNYNTLLYKNEKKIEQGTPQQIGKIINKTGNSKPYSRIQELGRIRFNLD